MNGGSAEDRNLCRGGGQELRPAAHEVADVVAASGSTAHVQTRRVASRGCRSGDLDPGRPSPVLLRSIMSALPHTLLILVHLHLLDYPLKHSAAYDERLFDPTRTGIRERTKVLEDISYFLVGRVEGSKGRARSVGVDATLFGCYRLMSSFTDLAHLSLPTARGYYCLPYLPSQVPRDVET